MRDKHRSGVSASIVVAAIMVLTGCSERLPEAVAATEPNHPAAASVAAVDISSGVFTDAQARRGEGVYAEHCASCHLPSMTGKEPAPQLAGALFLSKWRGLSVGDLYNRIMTTMPVNSPGTLSPQQYADLVALTLQANNFPAGDQELRADREYLQGIRIK